MNRYPLVYRLLRRAGRGFFHVDYKNWIDLYDKLDDADRAAIVSHIALLKRKSLISVIMPVFNPSERFLREAIQSVVDQLYDRWELCIADDCSTEPHVSRVIREFQAKDKRIKAVFRANNGNIAACSNSALKLVEGEFIALLDHDDVLREHALYMVSLAINQSPEADLIYSDEDSIDAHNRRSRPHFKPDWAPDLFYSQNMINHLGVYRTSLVRAISGFREGYEGSQDYDLALRIIEQTTPRDIVHIPHVLYHWRIIPASSAFSQSQLPRAVVSARRAVCEHLKRNGVQARVEPAPSLPQYQRVRRYVPSPEPLVSIVIPTKDKANLLRQCVSGILEQTAYTRIEVIIVNNHSVEQETLSYLRVIGEDSRVRVLDYEGEFNYSAINNYAMRQATGEIVGLLNNDIAIINREWLTELVSHAVRPEVGAVGAMLYYPSDAIQHAGIITGIGGVAGHSHKRFRRDHPGYFGRLHLTQNVSAVTGACLFSRLEVIEKCGGLDHASLGIAFNDVDLCLRIRQMGYLVVWTPFAELYHLESASRGLDTVSGKIERFNSEHAVMRARWGSMLENDPYYNPNLTLDKEDFSLSFPPRTKKPWLEHLKIGKIASD